MFVKHVCPLSAANYSCDKVIMHDFWPSDQTINKGNYQVSTGHDHDLW
jgi:hypothetical protein